MNTDQDDLMMMFDCAGLTCHPEGRLLVLELGDTSVEFEFDDHGRLIDVQVR